MSKGIDKPNLLGFIQPNVNGELAKTFLLPPFSVFNAREGWWQDRKRAWVSLGIKSELGRATDIFGGEGEGGGSSAWIGSADRRRGEGGVGSEGWVGSKGKKKALDYAAPSGAAMPATDYSKSRARDDGKGRAVKPAD